MDLAGQLITAHEVLHAQLWIGSEHRPGLEGQDLVYRRMRHLSCVVNPVVAPEVLAALLGRLARDISITARMTV